MRAPPVARLAKLRAENRNLSAEMAFQQALLELAEEKFGVLADSTAAAATGAEQERAAFRDVRLEWGELTGGVVGFAGQALSNWLRQATEDAQTLKLAIIHIGQAFGLLPRSWRSSWNPGAGTGFSAGIGSRTGIGAHIRQPVETFSGYTEDQEAAMLDWMQARQEIEDNAAEARLDATRQYERMIAREAEDFARQRARAEQQFADQIADIRAGAARREAQQLAELERRISDLRSDSAERIADLRAEGNERLAELEEDSQRQRERAAADHRETLLGAAARLDAAAVLAEQRRYAQSEREAAQDHQRRMAQERENLDERIAEKQEAHDKRLRQEQESLDKRIRQEQEAHARRIHQRGCN